MDFIFYKEEWYISISYSMERKEDEYEKGIQGSDQV